MVGDNRNGCPAQISMWAPHWLEMWVSSGHEPEPGMLCGFGNMSCSWGAHMGKFYGPAMWYKWAWGVGPLRDVCSLGGYEFEDLWVPCGFIDMGPLWEDHVSWPFDISLHIIVPVYLGLICPNLIPELGRFFFKDVFSQGLVCHSWMLSGVVTLL